MVPQPTIPQRLGPEGQLLEGTTGFRAESLGKKGGVSGFFRLWALELLVLIGGGCGF